MALTRPHPNIPMIERALVHDARVRAMRHRADAMFLTSHGEHSLALRHMAEAGRLLALAYAVEQEHADGLRSVRLDTRTGLLRQIVLNFPEDTHSGDKDAKRARKRRKRG